MFNRTINSWSSNTTTNLELYSGYTLETMQESVPWMEKSPAEKMLGWGLIAINEPTKIYPWSALKSTAIMINYLCDMYKCSTSIYVR